MRRVYPMGTTVMCILVPVLMLLAVGVWLSLKGVDKQASKGG